MASSESNSAAVSTVLAPRHDAIAATRCSGCGDCRDVPVMRDGLRAGGVLACGGCGKVRRVLAVRDAPSPTPSRAVHPCTAYPHVNVPKDPYAYVSKTCSTCGTTRTWAVTEAQMEREHIRLGSFRPCQVCRREHWAEVVEIVLDSDYQRQFAGGS